MRSTSREARETAYAEFVTARRTRLRRLAYLLCGDWERAEEVLQSAFTQLYVAWPRLEREGDEEAFVRRRIVRAAAPVHHRPEVVGEPDTLREAVLALPIKQRKAVLLHHWLGLSVEQTAEELGSTASHAQTQADRGLAALRTALAREVR
ncbi:MAG: sigma factor-like helix-turn-helix DNA-binding protein [Nocardioides sp.]